MEKETINSNKEEVEATDRVEELRSELETIRFQHLGMIATEIGYFLSSLREKYPDAEQYRLFHLSNGLIKK